MLDQLVNQSKQTYSIFSKMPAPNRGQFIREFGLVLRENKEKLARAITQDMGKTINESRGEVQEAIDMCDFAVGLSRQLYGLTMPSERPGHRIQESWLPLGIVGVISAFNFPVAVWAWNFCLASICGNVTIWKPSEKAENCARLVQELWNLVCARMNKEDLSFVNQIHFGGVNQSIELAKHTDINLISATGSTEMGKVIGKIVSERLGKSLLELGGNNASIVSQHSDLDLAIRGCVFASIGTTGQRCTTLRRLFVHESIFDLVIDKLSKAYSTVSIGDPHDENTLLGPLVSVEAYSKMQDSILQAEQEGGKLVYGGTALNYYNTTDAKGPTVKPAIIVTKEHLSIMHIETFAPILYVMPYADLQQAIDLVNCVSQGLSSSIYTNNLLEAEQFLQQAYTGIVNVNTSTSGAEIGGAFGGEKDTGGGRESGSDSWKNYMRRVTTTINYSKELPLAQGVKF